VLSLKSSISALAILALSASGPPARAEDAVSLAAAYRGDLWRNVDGGVQKGGRYFDDLLIGVTVDTERAVGLSGGTLNVLGLHNHGADLSGQFVGASQVISNIQTSTSFRLYEAWYEQRVFRDAVSVLAGLYDLNSEFDAIEPAALFINSSHGIGPDFAQSGQAGPSIFPVTALAARVDWQVTPEILLRAAILDGVPGDPARPKRVVAVKLGNGDGALIVGEIEATILDTTVKAGGWGYTARFDDLNAVDPVSGNPVTRGDNRGFYVSASRQVYSAGEDEGLSLYGRFGIAQGHINMFSSYLGAGAVYDNILPGTSVGFAVASAAVGKPYRRAQAALGLPSEKRETIFEATVRSEITPWLTLQPDVQYVVNPSAAPGSRNALVLGLRFEISGVTSF